MAKTLKLCLIEQTIPPQLDFLLHALASLTPAGDALVVPDDMLAETRRVLADLRRVLATTPLSAAGPKTAPVTRAVLRHVLREALSTYEMFDEVNRQAAVAQRREARRNKRLKESSARLSPHPFAHIE